MHDDRKINEKINILFLTHFIIVKLVRKINIDWKGKILFN